VVWFYLGSVLYLLITIGEDHHRFIRFWTVVSPIFGAFSLARQWRESQQRTVTGLDDRAQVEQGVNFDELSEAAQKELLGRYRMGRYVLDTIPDERQQMSQLRSQETAFRILGRVLPVFLTLYWASYLWVPTGDWRDMMMDAPIWVSWLAVYVVTLPIVVEMWNEPDEPGDLRAV